MPFVHGYIRVSTKDQADDGFSLDAQRVRIREEWERVYQHQGYEFGRVYEDRAQSGGLALASRTHGAELSRDLLPGDMVLFVKLDRGFRNTEDLLRTVRVWGERDVRCVFLDLNLDTKSPMGMFFLSMMGAWAQFERSQISERVRSAHSQMKREGKRIGGRLPYGVKVTGRRPNRKLSINEEQYHIGRHLLKWKQADELSWFAIAAHLNAQGVKRKTNGCDPARPGRPDRAWNVMAVRRAYRGFLTTLLWVEQKKVKLPAHLVKL